MPTIPHGVQTCDDQLCHGHGQCFLLHSVATCQCRLGYQGSFCEEKVSKPIAIPLTLGVLGVIIGLVVLAFLLSYLRRKATVYKRKLPSPSNVMLGEKKDALSHELKKGHE